MPIRITRVYTRTGDDGETALVGGRRVPKDAPRIEAYGTIDELNAVVGLARVFNAASRLAEDKDHRWLDEVLRRIQNELFDLGSELATPSDAVYEGMYRVGEAEVTALETLMDQCQKDLQPLKSFVLPGGGRVGGFLHQARTVCRRAERRVLRAVARRADRRVAAQVREPAERPALRALALGGQAARRDRVPLGARPRLACAQASDRRAAGQPDPARDAADDGAVARELAAYLAFLGEDAGRGWARSRHRQWRVGPTTASRACSWWWSRPGGEVAGTAAVRRLERRIGELKRMWIRPAHQGGRRARPPADGRLRSAEARALGYRGCGSSERELGARRACTLFRDLRAPTRCRTTSRRRRARLSLDTTHAGHIAKIRKAVGPRGGDSRPLRAGTLASAGW